MTVFIIIMHRPTPATPSVVQSLISEDLPKFNTHIKLSGADSFCRVC